MDRATIALQLLPSFFYPGIMTDTDYARAVDKAFTAADAFLDRLRKEPNTVVVTVDLATIEPSDCCCGNSVKLPESWIQEQESGNGELHERGAVSEGDAGSDRSDDEESALAAFGGNPPKEPNPHEPH